MAPPNPGVRESVSTAGSTPARLTEEMIRLACRPGTWREIGSGDSADKSLRRLLPATNGSERNPCSARTQAAVGLVGARRSRRPRRFDSCPLP